MLTVIVNILSFIFWCNFMAMTCNTVIPISEYIKQSIYIYYTYLKLAVMFFYLSFDPNLF